MLLPIKNHIEKFIIGLKTKFTEQPSLQELTSSKEGKKELSAWQQGLLWGLIFSFTATTSALLGATIALLTPLSSQIATLLENTEVYTGKQVQSSVAKSANMLTRPVNILFLGLESVNTSTKNSSGVFNTPSNTILLLRFTAQTSSLTVLSIPKDTLVAVTPTSTTKINQLNRQKDPLLVTKTISESLNNIAIDRYLRVTPEALKELINWLGGIEVFVPTNINHQELKLTQGWQTLNGEQADLFARFEDALDGDLGRVQRQQLLITAIVRRLQHPSVVPQIPEGIRLLNQYIETNLYGEEIKALANYIAALDGDALKMVILPGTFINESWLIEAEKRSQILSTYFAYPSAPLPEKVIYPQPLRIALQNTTQDKNLIATVNSFLLQRKFQNLYFAGDSPQFLAETEIIVQQGDIKAGEKLQQILGFGRLKIASTGVLDSQLTIRLGRDAEQFFTKPDLPTK